jgi:hypothetical protein
MVQPLWGSCGSSDFGDNRGFWEQLTGESWFDYKERRRKKRESKNNYWVSERLSTPEKALEKERNETQRILDEERNREEYMARIDIENGRKISERKEELRKSGRMYLDNELHGGYTKGNSRDIEEGIMYRCIDKAHELENKYGTQFFYSPETKEFYRPIDFFGPQIKRIKLEIGKDWKGIEQILNNQLREESFKQR